MFEIEEAYHRGYEQGYEACEKAKRNDWIEIGRNEAWRAVKKIYLSVDNGGLPGEDIRKIFGGKAIGTEIIKNFSASEVVKKLCVYEEKKKEESEIHVGDEVTNAAGDIGVVIGISNNDVSLFIPAWNISQITHKLCCKKTGRHFPEIVEALKKLREDK